jgi:hypothetical protein
MIFLFFSENTYIFPFLTVQQTENGLSSNICERESCCFFHSPVVGKKTLSGNEALTLFVSRTVAGTCGRSFSEIEF